MHNQIYLEIMDEYDRQYPIEDSEELYYYQQLQEAGFDPETAAELAQMDPQQRAAHIQQYRAMLAAQGHLNGEEFESDDDAMFFDNNDLANRIWEDNELEQDN